MELMATVSLAGMMGSGKSSVGRELSSLLSLHFIDLDDYIVRKEGRGIAEIFSDGGEAAFRKMEMEALEEILGHAETAGTGLVLSLGGGTLTTPECMSLIEERTFCIYLKAQADTLYMRLRDESEHRPMLKTEDGALLRTRIERLLDERGPLYEKTARRTIATDGLSVKQIAGMAAGFLREV